MKRTALLLAAALLLSLFASCSGGNGEVSETSQSQEPSSSTESSASAEASSEESKPDSIAPEYATSVSTGKSYKTSDPAGESYPDSYGAELTDGVYSPKENVSYTEAKLAGYAPASRLDVDIDLGEETDKLWKFEVSVLLSHEAGIAPPSNIKVLVSSDGENYEAVGYCKACEFTEGTTGVYTLEAKKYSSARYVRFAVTKASAWVFIDEMTVYADVKPEAGEDVLAKVNEIYTSENADYAGNLAAFKSGDIDRTLDRVLISSSRSYKLEGNVIDKFADKDGKLTDGNSTVYYESGSWVGFDGKTDASVTLTLGTNKGIGAFSVYAYGNTASSIYFPACVVVSLSSNGKEYLPVSRVYSPSFTGGRYVFTVELPYAVSAKYVKFTLVAPGSGTVLIDETAVYSYSKESSQDSMYPEINIPIISTPVYYPSTDSDYSVKQNLIAGKGQQLMTVTTPDQGLWGNNTPQSSDILTDGKYSADNNIHNGSFFKFNAGSGRMIIYDLGASCAVESLTASFLNRNEWGVAVPSTVNVYLSGTGSDWYLAGRIAFDKAAKEGVQKNTLTLQKAVVARYVVFSFAMASSWAGCDEIEIYGTKKTANAVSLDKSGFEIKNLFINKTVAPSSDILKGAEDICLMYHSTSYDYSAETFMPYLAYTGKDGKMTDVMFDGYLFLLSGAFPSGVAGHLASNKTDWEWELSSLFTDGKNISALNEAAGKAKAALGKSDYKYKYYLTIYYPRVGQTNFGDVDGDGVSENLSVFANRKKVIEWYVALALDYVKKADFENLEFGGFYWFHESVEEEDDSLTLINMVSDTVHGKGYQLFWIPYFCSNGYSDWSEYGFDVACMQPNYVFKETAALSNIKINAALIKLYGMCFEMEICGNALTDRTTYDRYTEYLKGGVYYGYMNDCIHMYYQDMQVFYNACKAQDELARSVYDYTYQFIKGTLDISPESKPEIKLEVSSGSPASGNAGSGSAVELYTVTVMPSHGTVTVNPDGTFVYYPDHGYTGSDSFGYVYTEGLDYSEECKVTVNVK